MLFQTVAADNAALVQLMEELSAVKNSDVQFVEKKVSTLLTEPVVLKGKLSYRRPDYLAKHVQHPYRESYIIEGDALTIDSADGGTKRVQLPDHPGVRAFVESYRATLNGDLERLSRYYTVRLEQEQQHWRLTMVPVDATLKHYVERVVVHGSGTQLGRVQVVETGGDQSTTLLTPTRD